MDDTDYAEFNPAPYAGGYDISLTYGHSLPPSDVICYSLGSNNPPRSSSKNVSSNSFPQSSSGESLPVSSAAGDLLLEDPPFDYRSMICEDGGWLPPAWWNKYWPNSSYNSIHGGEEQPVNNIESFAGEEVVQYGSVELPMDDSFMGMDYLGASLGSFLGDGIMGNGGGRTDHVSVSREPWEDAVDYLLGTSLSVDYYG